MINAATKKAEFTADEKYGCLVRECRKREQVYPRFIDRGSMSRDFAVKQLKMMREICEEYRQIASGERLI